MESGQCSVYCKVECMDEENEKEEQAAPIRETPFECDICGKKCSEKGNLKKHKIRIHR